MLKIRFTPTAAPTADCPVETAMPPARATLTSLSSAVRAMAPPARIVLFLTWASTTLLKRFRATDPAMASFSDPAPPTASVTTVPASPAVALKPPVVRSVDPSTMARTSLSTVFTAMAAPIPAFLPAAKAPAKE
ncbi:MAG: hypothetical protein A4E73_00365 [Syntrophaceae bacterium PtaU1.Bin231]|nr:MAG: hypothetical protein A4E73_00365 [Syntrophaceae bacterium PtaU1.Bin231]